VVINKQLTVRGIDTGKGNPVVDAGGSEVRSRFLQMELFLKDLPQLGVAIIITILKRQA